jgi:hypothetical protein
MKKSLVNQCVMTFTLLMLTGCATLSLTDRIACLHDEAKGQQLYFMDLPTANNPISDQMMVAAIAMNPDLPSVRDLVLILKANNGQAIGVTSQNDAITAATIKSALSQMNGVKSNVKLLYFGKSDYIPELSELAKSVGVDFEGLSCK